MKIKKLTILGGYGKDKKKEKVRKLVLTIGDIISIVGPTGSGKTEFINDIERFANGNTPSKRKVLINEKVVTDESYLKNPIALITQHTNFLSDLPVNVFLATHAEVRGAKNIPSSIKETIEFANQLTGEPIDNKSAMTELSGGQTRALLIADAVIIGNSPIILLDEIENAGIDKVKALELMKPYKKIFIFVTHDPRITLLSDFRIVMKNGAMQKIIMKNKEEKDVANEINKMDTIMHDIRTRIRNGERLTKII